MKAIPSRLRLYSETGFTLVELLTAMVVMGIILGGLSDMFISTQRANSDATARLTSQQNVRLAFDRLEYDTRCASTAALQSSGQGVHLSLPSYCSHSNGDVTWCVSSGSLVRIAGTSCSTAGIKFVSGVTSSAPFSCYTVPGITSPLPQLKVALTVDTTTRTSDQTSATDYITMRNAPSGACT
jgi:prepilin-type N-terminal cleavage/methylation domain-containing protein